MKKISFFVALLIIATFNSCQKEQAQIPSYVRIDGVTVVDTLTQGLKTSNNISDDWVTVIGNYIGTFQNPTRFPVLTSGNTPFLVYAGVKANGTAETREIYPFLKPWTPTLKLTPGQVLNVKPVFHYFSNIKVPINDIFEDDSDKTFVATTSGGFAKYTIVHDTAEVFSGKGSLYAQLVANKDSLFLIQTKNGILLPIDKPVWMELNFKVDMPISIGLTETDVNNNSQHIDYIDLQPTAQWKKIYIDFTSITEANTPYTTFFFTILGTLPSGQQTGNIYLDNVRLLYFPD